MDWIVTHSCGDMGVWPWPTPTTRGQLRRLDEHLAYLRTVPCRVHGRLSGNEIDEWDDGSCDCHGYPCCYCIKCYPLELEQELDLPLYLEIYRRAGIEISA